MDVRGFEVRPPRADPPPLRAQVQGLHRGGRPTERELLRSPVHHHLHGEALRMRGDQRGAERPRRVQDRHGQGRRNTRIQGDDEGNVLFMLPLGGIFSPKFFLSEVFVEGFTAFKATHKKCFVAPTTQSRKWP